MQVAVTTTLANQVTSALKDLGFTNITRLQVHGFLPPRMVILDID